MATIVVTEPGLVVPVKNGDRLIIDIPGGGDVTVVAANAGVRNFQVDFTDDTLADTLKIDLSSFSKDNLQILVRDYDPTDRVVLMGSTGGGVSPGQHSDYDFTFPGPGGGSLGGRVRVLDPGEKDLTVHPPPIIICFAAGTLIETAAGPRAVEDLGPGDLVVTADNGLKPVRWVGRRRLGPEVLAGFPHLRPVLIRRDAFGPGLPLQDLTVSPQHRIRIADWRTELLFGETEVLVPAKALIDGRGIVEAPDLAVTYCHILFDRHEIVLANGLPCESLHPGDVAAGALRSETWDIFEGGLEGLSPGGTVLVALRYREARTLVDAAV